MPELRALPFKEAIAYFKFKGYALEPSHSWKDVWHEQHAAAFTVAKTVGFDVLKDIHQALEKALGEGKTFEQFQRELRPTLEAKGWWGRKPVVDPKDGKIRDAQLGSPRRLKTIFDVNMRTAYAGGRWAQIQRTHQRRPYLRYVAVMDNRTRPDHKQWHGTVRPVTDPFWDTHFPPNGWRCRCTIQQLSDRDLTRYGYQVSPRPEVTTRSWRNDRTGERLDVPDGIDPGWGYNPGKAAQDAQAARICAGKAAEGPAALSAAMLHETLKGEGFERFLAGKVDAKWPMAVLPDELTALTKASQRTIVMSAETAIKQAKHPEATAASYLRLQRMLDEGEVIRDGDRHLVFVMDDDGAPWYAVVKTTASGGENYLQSFRRTDAQDWRKTREGGEVVREGRARGNR